MFARDSNRRPIDAHKVPRPRDAATNAHGIMQIPPLLLISPATRPLAQIPPIT
jgi:hypothetical protein